VRWLFVKDLQILRRSPLLVGLLVLYPVAIGLLIGFSFNRGPEKPPVAIVNEVPRGEKLTIGGEQFDLFRAKDEAFKRVDPVRARSRQEAIDKVRSGEALGALIIPRDTVEKLQSPLARPTIELFVNEEDPLKGRLVNNTITSLLADANLRLSRAFDKVILSYLGLLLHGGSVNFLGQQISILGLDNVQRITREAQKKIPRSRDRRELGRVVQFTQLARQNLDLTDDVLSGVSQPIRVDKRVLSGSVVPLSTFAAALAVAVSLAFVAVLLAAGSLALERSENAFDRLVRGPLTRTDVLVEKLLLSIACSVAVTLAMLMTLGLFIPLEWDRFALWLLGLVLAAAAFAGMGVAIGGLAREVSVASLLAFALLIPVTFLALVPSGVVGATLYDVTRFLSAVFPFKPTLKAMSAALYGKGVLVGPLLHLFALALGFAVAGRIALRRFA
jgi:ABC-type multidrug transport system permease subunit